MANYRNRKLLDLAHRCMECPCCGVGTPDGCEPAHANWSSYGKGMSIKAHDCFHAAMCHDCHAAMDQGSAMDRVQKLEFWRGAFERTLLHYWREGWLSTN